MPYLSHIKVWGCLAYVKRTMSEKLEAKSYKCPFVGYPKETIGYKFYHTLEQRLFVSKHVVILEKEFLLRGDSRRKVEFGEVQDAQIDADHLTKPEVVIHGDEVAVDPSKTQALCRISRIHTVIKKYELSVNRGMYCSSEFDKWFIAIKSEMNSMYAN